MEVKDVNGFIWRCGNINCEWLMSSYANLKEVPKVWKCPNCGSTNKFHFAKLVFKVEKSKKEKKKEKIYVANAIDI